LRDLDTCNPFRYLNFLNIKIVHNDLKPSNVLYEPSSKLYKICDFGFSKLSNLKSPSSFNVGTVNYMSPQALSKNLQDFSSDVWSIGVIFFELLYGKVPFEGATEK